MEICVLVDQDLFLWVDVETHTFEGEIATNAMRKGEWERG
jgi:hypothetical protein